MINILFPLPNSKPFSDWRRARHVSWVKLTNSLGLTKLTNSLGKQQYELARDQVLEWLGSSANIKGANTSIQANVAHQAGAYPGFCSMKQLGVFLLPPDGMLVHRRVTPAIIRRYPFMHLGQRRHWESSPDRSLRSRAH